MKPIPILLYHGISPTSSEAMASFTVAPDVFARHMDLIVEGGYRTMTVSELVDEMRRPQPELDNTVLATFDDGYADFTENALPILTGRNVASTMYITTGYVDSPAGAGVTKPKEPIMSWGEIAELPAAPVAVEVGAHSHSHPQMDTLSAAQVWEELIRSKGLLEDALDAPVRSFAYPHGYNSPQIRRQTQEAGYDNAAGVRNAFSHASDDTLCLARLTVRSFTEESTVADWIAGRQASIATPKEALKTKGWRSYRKLKRMTSPLTQVRP